MTGQLHIGPPKTESGRREVAVSDEVVGVLRDQYARVREQRKACLKGGKPWVDNDLVFPAQNGNYIYPRNANRDYYLEFGTFRLRSKQPRPEKRIGVLTNWRVPVRL